MMWVITRDDELAVMNMIKLDTEQLYSMVWVITGDDKVEWYEYD